MKLQALSYRLETASVRTLELCSDTIGSKPSHLQPANFAAEQNMAPGS
jgi:hypothetical protein